ncbi:protein kinase [Streptomyces sp. NPDC052225]|uniref:protein kinase domain-containing protein n=1 Tax=Streptomyces sp. NPDC052225 TaxID=3154949 RepID=UPI0034461937
MRGRLLSGRYRLLETIGSGGMGQVWRARDEDLGRLVALKVFAPPDDIEAGERAELVRRFRREARAVAALASPYVVTVYDHGADAAGSGAGTDDGDVPYLVMELVGGESLQEILRREVRVPVEQALEWTRQAALGLAAAHAAGIVHRDVKPANIMVTRGDPDAVRILDFGIAAFLEGAEAATRLTRTGTLPIGSVLYMAPERFRQEPGDGRIDLYALGCVLYELLVGRPPFTGPAAGVMYNHLHDIPVRPSRARADVPVAVDELVAALMAKRAADRPADAGGVAVRLAALREEARAPKPRPTPMPKPQPQPQPQPQLAPAPKPKPAPTPGPRPRWAATPAPRPSAPARRRHLPPARRRLALFSAIALTGVAGAVAVPSFLARPEAPQARPAPVFRIAVLGRGVPSVDLAPVEQALRDYGGRLPLEAVGVPHADWMTPQEFARKFPDVVAVVGDTTDAPSPPGTPELRTCQARDGRAPAGFDEPDAGLGERFASYLEDVRHTTRLLALGVPAPGDPVQAAFKERFVEARGDGRAYASSPKPPAALGRPALRALLAKARPDTVYLADGPAPEASVAALRDAGFQGTVVLAPDRRDDCDLLSPSAPRDRLPDGVLRFRTVSNSPFRSGECLQVADWCDRVRPLMTRPGALEQYEAAQAVVAAFRSRAIAGTGARAVRDDLKAALPEARVNGLQGDYTLASLGRGTARPVWVERRESGTWKTLGTVAGLTRD